MHTLNEHLTHSLDICQLMRLPGLEFFLPAFLTASDISRAVSLGGTVMAQVRVAVRQVLDLMLRDIRRGSQVPG